MRMILASNNAHKAEELRAILSVLGVETLTMRESGFSSDPEENGTTFAENAYIKAKAVYDICKLPTVADDSGICVEALGGEPGVYSARYGGEGYDDEGRMLLLLKNMERHENRTANFTSSISCVIDDETVISAEGYVFGQLTREPRGTNGFGYDPIFLPNGYDQTTAEMESEAKNAISHRGNALRLLVNKLKEYYDAE